MSNKLPSNGGWIQTFTGRKFYPLAPNPNDIHIADIARALSLQCRFSGHIKHHYSVAQHSIIVAGFVYEWLPDGVQTNILASLVLTALLHDASEAYITDIVRPLKRLDEFAFYRAAEVRLDEAISARYGLLDGYSEIIKQADNKALATEKRDLVNGDSVWETLPNADVRVIKERHTRVVERDFLNLASALVRFNDTDVNNCNDVVTGIIRNQFNV